MKKKILNADKLSFSMNKCISLGKTAAIKNKSQLYGIKSIKIYFLNV
jgi:hypothetical protein